MIDRDPSGHIAEYQKIQSVGDIILAILRQEGERSTFMMDEYPPYIILFHFKESCFEVIDNVLEWAEKTMKEKIKKYKYPWR